MTADLRENSSEFPEEAADAESSFEFVRGGFAPDHGRNQERKLIANSR